jgi:hypothetical protein
MQRLYKKEQLKLRESLETAVKRAGGWLRRPPAWESVVIESPGSMDVNTEAEVTVALEAVTKQQTEKLQQTVKT